jgi:hypothetical protein
VVGCGAKREGGLVAPAGAPKRLSLGFWGFVPKRFDCGCGWVVPKSEAGGCVVVGPKLENSGGWEVVLWKREGGAVLVGLKPSPPPAWDDAPNIGAPGLEALG